MESLAEEIDCESTVVRTASSELSRRVLMFCRLLTRGGLNVTPGRLIDVFRSILHVDLLDPDAFRVGLRVNLVASREEEEIFDRLFEGFWRNATHAEETITEFEMEERPEDDHGEHPESPPDELGSPLNWSSDETSRELDLASRLTEVGPSAEQLVRELARRLATRPSRRVKPVRRGRRVDLRRSLRRNAQHGMDLLELRRTKRRIRKTRLVFLCDVSGSMDTYNPFLLELMFGVQKVLRGSRTVVFSTRATEISAMLRQRSVAETLRDVARRARHWSGGTDIGEALATLNRRILREGTPRSTVAIILSDGYDQGEPARIEAEMRALQRRVRKVVWINPLLGTEGYAPIAKGMRAALPYVDHFLPAHDVASLRALCRDLAKA
jgi:hypothetical protein